MAKRFTDTDKWKKTWFRKLSPLHKVFWEYIRDNCDNAGIWDVDFELAAFQIGTDLDEEKIRTVFKKQFIEVNNKKWFLTDFVEWQYNCSIEELNPKNNAHLSVLRIVDKYKIKGLIRGLSGSYNGPKNKDKDKDQDKDKEKDKDKPSLFDRGVARRFSKRAEMYFPTVKNDMFLFAEDILKLRTLDKLSKRNIWIIYRYLAEKPTDGGFHWFFQIGTPGKLRARSKGEDKRKFWAMILQEIQKPKEDNINERIDKEFYSK